MTDTTEVWCKICEEFRVEIAYRTRYEDHCPVCWDKKLHGEPLDVATRQ